MGSGGKTEHATYATAPTAKAPEDDITGLQEPEAAADTDDWELKYQQWQFEDAIEDLDKFAQGVDFHALENPSNDELGAWYQDLGYATSHAVDQLTAMAEVGAPHETLDAAIHTFENAVHGALDSLTPEELRELAREQGFDHPELVGATTQDGQPHPLAVWLNPTTPEQAKHRIQAKAQERFAALCADEIVAGLSYTDIQPPTGQHGTWTATSAQLQGLAVEAQAHTSGFAEAVGPTAKGEQLAALIEVENQLATAYCPAEDDASVASVKAQTTGTTDALLEQVSPYSPALSPALNAARVSGKLTDEQWAVLSMPAGLRLARESTPSAEKETLKDTANQRMAQVLELKSAYTALVPYLDSTGGSLQLPEKLSADDPDSVAAVTGFAQAAHDYMDAKDGFNEWFPHTPLNLDNAPARIGISLEELDVHNDTPDLTTQFATWAAKKDPKALKQTAAQLGLDETSGVNVSDTKKWIAAQWDPSISTEQVKNHIAAKQQKAASKGKSGDKTGNGTAQEQKPVPTHGTAQAAEKTGWPGKHAKLVQALQQHGAAWQELPKPLDSAIVAEHDFGSGTSGGAFGGVHTKSVHTGPDGKTWMFKADHQTKGAKASAEAAASSVFAAAGVPAVPVYTAKVNGKEGVVQPVVPNTTQLSSDPAVWGQSDVDALVRAHVVSWTVGDHDSNPANVLKTSAGGIVPVDAGQAFKYCGKDKLAADYHPNAKYGSPLPAHHKAYTAHASGELAKDVKIKPAVAHPVIAKLEKIPDTQWRAMLHSTAYKGAKSGEISWVPAMRERAAQKHAIPQSSVSTEQIAEAFLDHACARKNTLRSTFAEFFDGLGIGGTAALKYGA